MPVDKSRVLNTPCVIINAGEWFRYEGFEDFLCQESVATYADQEELNRNRWNREKGYESNPYVPDCDTVFMWAEWDIDDKDSKGRPLLATEGDILEEHCPQAYDELVDLLLEVGFVEGVIVLVNQTKPPEQATIPKKQ